MELESIPCRDNPAFNVDVDPASPRRVRVSRVIVSTIIEPERAVKSKPKRRHPAYVRPA